LQRVRPMALKTGFSQGRDFIQVFTNASRRCIR